MLTSPAFDPNKPVSTQAATNPKPQNKQRSKSKLLKFAAKPFKSALAKLTQADSFSSPGQF